MKPQLTNPRAHSNSSRRQFVRTIAIAGMGWGFVSLGEDSNSNEPLKRKMTINLVCGAIGVSADQRQAIDLAAKYGFESVEAYVGYLAGLSEQQADELKGYMKTKA